jgi:hypothetical protein
MKKVTVVMIALTSAEMAVSGAMVPRFDSVSKACEMSAAVTQ